MRDTMQYIKSTAKTENGVETREPDETVGETFVTNFISPATLEWFRNLGGTEQVTKHRDGRIVVRSVSPDGTESRFTVFTPVSGNEG